jgi:hypothetical protein
LRVQTLPVIAGLASCLWIVAAGAADQGMAAANDAVKMIFDLSAGSLLT